MIEIHIDGKDPREVIREVFHAAYILGQSVRIVAAAGSAAQAIACGAEAVASAVRQQLIEDWAATRMREDVDHLRELAVGIVPTPVPAKPIYSVRHDVADSRAQRMAKVRRKAERPRWRQ